jgi:hypothetical protein
LGPFGVDTVAYRFRPGWPEFMDRLLRAPHRFAGGARVMAEKPGGIAVAVFQGAIRVEGRLDPLLTGERDSWGLRPVSDLVAGERRARQLVEHLAGAPMDGGREYFGDGELARVDAAHELEFEDAPDGLTFLRAVAAMRPSMRKADVAWGVDGQPQTIYFRTPKRFAVRERIYDKGVESGSHPAGLRVRLEAQRRFPKNRAMPRGALPAADLGRYYAEKLQAYAQTDTLAAGPDQARRELLAKVHSGQVTMRVAARLLGDVSIFAEFGRAAYPNAKMAQRRLKALRDHGVAIEDVLPPERSVPVGRLLRESIESWTAAA